ncbi:MBL fold metallo-hydrolase [Corynebacterium uberis]|uniref:MBL fold metallo-hydrolase n=1 Tax=Corynebacterium TaxID=1716 RepID=UPI001D0B2714|nr:MULTISPECIES: MBL fold metallo-hydrolase [Corynebacterium]MCZ9308550.1 MBL fold metallo-hydrolase [Corynebacterium sp. c6VSa_13]UDL74202.1 MBL fold metallo-hydrolase [Corynebacterium uberis]UDL74915.1 MBL fold metallo-hydrolase [Corynebacterium uberis]UDL77129.1 MBL fold metallo-hydrolase [Corynebacterium uberis]UDL79412.1 MBL fold metallo-hydrolase [Corynebacterium uberis]
MEILGCVAGAFSANCYLLVADGKATVLDPGAGAFEPVMATVERRGLEVAAIVLTHGHLDHTFDAGRLAAECGVAVHLHPDDEWMLTDAHGGIGPLADQYFDLSSWVQVEQTVALVDAAPLTLGGEEFTVRHAPGHSPGSVLLVGQKHCFSGDVLFRGAIGRTDLPGSDPAAMRATLAGPVWQLDNALEIHPGHGPGTTMGAERGGNPYLRLF